MTEDQSVVEETETASTAEDEPVDAVTVADLEEEGDAAADYVEELLDICDLDGDIDIDVHDGRVYISIASAEETSNISILGDADAVLALQELTRLAVQAKTGRFSRLILDVQNSRERRAHELETVVDDALGKINAGAERVPLAPMSSYERKLIHDLAAQRGLESESEGQGRDRHIVLARVAD